MKDDDVGIVIGTKSPQRSTVDHRTVSTVAARYGRRQAEAPAFGLIAVLGEVLEAVGVDDDIVCARAAGFGFAFSLFVRRQGGKRREIVGSHGRAGARVRRGG